MWNFRQATLRRWGGGDGPITASRRECLPARSCNSAPATISSAAISGSGGNIGRAARCLLSIRTNATRRGLVTPPSKTARSWSKSIAWSGSRMRQPGFRSVLSVAFAFALAMPAVAQQALVPAGEPVMTRDRDGHATVRAVRLTPPLRIDGRLDEDIYRTIPPITDFIQTLPKNNGEPTERTEAWVMFDGEYIYAAARCWDSAPPDKWTANEMRRDANQIRQNDHFGFMLDTFHDRRNGYVFYANPLGGRIDLAETDEGNSNSDWNPV